MTILFSIVSGTELEARWGANAFLLAGIAALMWMPGAISPSLLRAVFAITIGTHILLCLGSTLGKTVVANHAGRSTRDNFPSAELASRVENAWKARTDKALRVVVADIWIGGNITAFGPHGMAVLIDGDFRKAPWIGERDVFNCGAMVLDNGATDQAGSAADHAELRALIANAETSGTWSLTSKGVGAPTRIVHWAYFPPHDVASCSQ